jgi:hypothetical protein
MSTVNEMSGETNKRHPLRRAASDPSLRSALITFTLTRFLVLAILIVGGQMGRVATGSGETVREMFLSLEKTQVARILRQTVTTADINWYHGIAENGYEKTPFRTDKPHNWAFFPLFPLLWRLGFKLTGELPITGMALSHLFFLAALIFVHKAALAFGFSKNRADRSISYLAIFPTSYFYSLPLTESLFLLLTAATFYSAKSRHWWRAGVLGALASATRVTGVFILPALAVLYWQTFGGDWRSKAAWRQALWRKELVSLCVVPAGVASYMCYLYAITGNPLAFKDILVTWGRGTGFFLITLFDYVRNPLMIAVPWDFRILNFAGACLALACGVILLKWKQWALGIYTLVAVIAALSSLVLQSQARYAMVLFPVFMVLAVAGKRRRVDEVIRTIFVGLLCLMTALFAAHFTMALS